MPTVAKKDLQPTSLIALATFFAGSSDGAAAFTTFFTGASITASATSLAVEMEEFSNWAVFTAALAGSGLASGLAATVEASSVTSARFSTLRLAT